MQEKVLIIDDEDFILKLSEDILEKSHYVVKTTSDGKEGLSLLKTDKLVLSHFKWVTQVRQAQSDTIACVECHGDSSASSEWQWCVCPGELVEPYGHQEGLIEGCYTHNKRPVKLMYVEEFGDIVEAISREKQIRGWSRQKKKALIAGDFEKLVKLSKSNPSTFFDKLRMTLSWWACRTIRVTIYPHIMRKSLKKHPSTGAKIIESVEPLKYAKEIIKSHQECFDGTGYPEGLKGKNIPLGARIIAVADAFGAMTTDRPYRKALSIKEALEELRKYSGTQFDPHLVKIFISILEEEVS